MPSHEGEAIVLRQYPFAEADVLVVLLTREVGKLRVVASGARRPKSRLGASLQPLNQVELQFHIKEGAELGRVLEAETLHSFLGRSRSLERLYAFSYVAEVIQEVAQEN